jgi:hypothetical protein
MQSDDDDGRHTRQIISDNGDKMHTRHDENGSWKRKRHIISPSFASFRQKSCAFTGRLQGIVPGEEII